MVAAKGAGPESPWSDDSEITRTFSGVQRIEISVASSSVEIVPSRSSEVEVHLVYSYPKDRYTPTMTQNAGGLKLSEEFERGTVRGRGVWHLAVPSGIEVSVSSASGNVTADGVTAGVRVNTASGRVEITGARGPVSVNTSSGGIHISSSRSGVDVNTASGVVELSDLEGETRVSTASGGITVSKSVGSFVVNTASGRVQLNGLRGGIKVSSASGHISSEGTSITGASAFAAASGDIRVVLAGTNTSDLSLTSASGDAVLDYDGHAVRGLFTFEARRNNGEIRSPYRFDRTETFVQGGVTYDRKSHTVDVGAPRIRISTASGVAQLKR